MSKFFASPMRVIFAALALLFVLMSTFSIVPETKQAVVLSFGQPIRVINPYRANQPIGGTGAGLMAKIPFVEQVQWIDKRVLGVNLDQQPVLSTDQLRMEVDAYARFRIVDPLKMYTTIRTEEQLKTQLGGLLSSSLREELGKRTFATLLSAERGEVMNNIRNGLGRAAANYGAQIIDVRIKRADLPSGAPLDSAYARMRTARDQAARTIAAEGRKEAQIIRAEADAKAAKIYADAYGRDPNFYKFYRAMQSYRQTFLSENDEGTTVVMTPDDPYLDEFRAR